MTRMLRPNDARTRVRPVERRATRIENARARAATEVLTADRRIAGARELAIRSLASRLAILACIHVRTAGDGCVRGRAARTDAGRVARALPAAADLAVGRAGRRDAALARGLAGAGDDAHAGVAKDLRLAGVLRRAPNVTRRRLARDPIAARRSRAVD